MVHLILFKSSIRFLVRDGRVKEREKKKVASEKKQLPHSSLVISLVPCSFCFVSSTESLEGKMSIVLHSKGQKSLGMTENGNCFVQVAASKS